MKQHLAFLCALVIPGGLLFAQKFDINEPQSPAKPTPRWIKMTDQGPNDPRLKGYSTPEGVKVEIVAEGPMVANPAGMAFADDGTLFVLEWRPGAIEKAEQAFTYKDGSTRKVPVAKKKIKDAVKELQYNADRGIYDQAKVVLEEELPSGVLLYDGWLYLCGQGTVRRYKQSKEAGPYDAKEVIAQGFGGYYHRQVSGLTVGNDGWLYITCGSGDHYVEGSDGSRATVLRTGAVFRCRPDGSRMHVYSIGYCNPYRDVAFDPAGNCFQVDNDGAAAGKFAGCRLMHVAEESDFGWRCLPASPKPDSVRAAAFGELPGKMKPMLKTGRGAASGLLIYNDSRFPEQYQGLLYFPDIVRRTIRAYRLEPYGATFTVANEFELLKSDDPLFRPCQMTVGPDGAMYVCDWRNDPAGPGDGKNGRIYRLRWSGTDEEAALPLRGMDSWAKIARLSDEDLMKKLASADFGDRLRAQRELARRGPKNGLALIKVMLGDERPQPARIAAVGALQSLWTDEVRNAFLFLLREGDDDLRRLAADALALNCRKGDRVAAAALHKALGDDHLSVKRAVALAIGRIDEEGGADALINMLRFDRENDAYLSDGIVRAIERMGKGGINRLVDAAQSGVPEDQAFVLTAFYGMRCRAAADALPALVAYRHVGVPERWRLVGSYSNYLLDPPMSLKPLRDFVAENSYPQPVFVPGAVEEAVKHVKHVLGEQPKVEK